MAASNAMELTPQISELLFKTNPDKLEFCLVFRRRGPGCACKVPREFRTGKPRRSTPATSPDQFY
jgi:hypothetical protein